MNKIAIVVALVVCIGGCGGEPRLDTSTEERAYASLEKMTDKMPDSEKEVFVKQCMLIEIKLAKMKGEPKPPAKATSLKSLHGMTVEEIRAKFKELNPPE